ncbi:MAG TPA: Gfo/Idh/MocA family oxidoreductase [Thermoguttaceae bacterium]|nr:Gfo/Idh/MocA family oxidoreductase [Thermoguttaceae bacterium]
MKPLRMAVIGAGRLGGFHAQKAAANPDVELVAVVDPVPAARNRVAAECRTKAAADYRGLAGSIDAAIVASPTKLHHRIALDLARQGIHLLVEKPLCASLAEADELVEAADAAGIVLQVGHVERFSPAFVTAAPYLAQPKYIEAVRASGFTFRSTDVGAVLDLMIHDIDLILSLVGSPVRRVEAMGVSVIGGHEDVANARITFESGCVATLSASRVHRAATRRMQVWTPRTYVELDFGALTVAVVQPSESLLRREFDIEELSPAEVEWFKDHLLDEHLPQEQIRCERIDALAAQQADFVESIRAPRRPRVSGRQGRDALALAEDILGKIHTHAWDDQADGPVGPMAVPRPSVVPAPHWSRAPVDAPLRRAAG